MLDEDEEQESQEYGLSLANAGLVLLMAPAAGLAMAASSVAMLVSQFPHAGKFSGFYPTHWRKTQGSAVCPRRQHAKAPLPPPVPKISQAHQLVANEEEEE